MNSNLRIDATKMNALLLLLLTAVPGPSEPIDKLQYTSDNEARAHWTPSEGTPPVIAYNAAAGHALQATAPFASMPEIRRVVIDRKVTIDLTAASAFTMDVNLSHPTAVTHLSLYFHSENGWFAGAARLSGKGWQTLQIDKSAFGREDEPAGWDKIDGVRIAIWKSMESRSEDGAILLRHLNQTWNNTAIVLPDSDEEEWKASFTSADTLEEMLGELGVGVDRISETSILTGSIGKRTLLLLPYNRPPDQVGAVIKRFVDEGGKVFLCYSIPQQLQQSLGFSSGEYYRPGQGEPQLESIRFDAADMAGLPDSVEQASWNLAVSKPVSHGARVIGWWYDSQGKPTDKPAILLSQRGAYLSHVILRDDWEAKKRMLAAVLAALRPEVWQEIVATGVERAQRIGHCRSHQELVATIASEMGPTGREQMRAADVAFADAGRLIASGKGFEAYEAISRCRQLRIDAYLGAQPSPPVEARAFWEHSGMGAYPGDWDRTCRELVEAGFNMIIPNMLWAGVAHYPSDVLPRSQTFAEHGDQIEQCLTAAKKYGLEVHIWKVNHNPGHLSPREFIDRMRNAGRTQIDVHGEVTDWLNPAHPQNFQLEVDSMLEVVRKYDVAGIHFDYIRYPNNDLDYSDFSRQKFEVDTGLKITNWPDECHSGKLREAYRDWRANQITRLVETISGEARKIRPGIKVSAAVFADYPDCRDSVAQEWPLWAERGYVDFLCPMNYTEDDDQFIAWIEQQRNLVDNIPLYPGIGVTASRATLTADRVVGQIHITRRLGADGFTLFELSENTAKTVLPAVHASASRTEATAKYSR